MAHRTPTVREGELHTATMTVPIESAAWLVWLAQHDLFRFTTAVGSFTARREMRGGHHYWYAYRRDRGKLRNAYLGKDDDLTLARLHQIALALNPTDDAPAPDYDLTGKATPPLLATASVARERLLMQLGAITRVPLTIVAAPAGYGKTTLLAQWAQRHRATTGQLPLAWLTLDAHDNDPARLQQQLTTALLHCGLRTPNLTTQRTNLGQYLNAAAQQAPLIVILDDYHTITTAAIHDALADLLNTPPPGLHLVLASRTEPPLPLARLRVRAALLELSADDLRFTLAETATFVTQHHGLALDRDTLAALDARSEGWAAALQLAAHALQGRDPAEHQTILAAFNGAHHLLDDYLATEVLNRLPPPLLHFLYATAIAERLSPALAAALTGLSTEEAQAALRTLERTVLLVQPLDPQRRWYRYHPLLAECLRVHLERTNPDQLRQLHRQASCWYEAQHDFPEAAQHATAAQDFDRLAKLLVSNVERLMARGEVATIRHWIEALPPRLIHDHPEITLWLAWTYSLGDDLEMIEPLLRTLEARLADLTAQLAQGLPVPIYARQANPAALLGQADAMRAIVARRREHYTEAVHYAQAALDRLPPDLVLRSVIARQLGLIHFRCGDLRAAGDALAEAVTNADRTGHSLNLVGALNGLARVRLAEGDRAAAQALLRRSRHEADRSGNAYLLALATAGVDTSADHNADPADHDEEVTLLAPLRPREHDILRLLAAGLSDRAIAAALELAPNTVRWYTKHLYSKLGAANRTHAVGVARRLGLLAE